MLRQARSKLSNAKDAVQDTFFSVKGVFEDHKLVFTIGTSILSAGAAWAGYVGRQMHQQHLENRLNSIENAMKSQHNLDDDEVKVLTKTGVSFKACFATVGTASVITYILGFRSGRKFTLKQIQKQQQRLLAGAKTSHNHNLPIFKRSLAALRLQRLSLFKRLEQRRKKLEAQKQLEAEKEQQLSPECAGKLFYMRNLCGLSGGKMYSPGIH